MKSKDKKASEISLDAFFGSKYLDLFMQRKFSEINELLHKIRIKSLSNILMDSKEFTFENISPTVLATNILAEPTLLFNLLKRSVEDKSATIGSIQVNEHGQLAVVGNKNFYEISYFLDRYHGHSMDGIPLYLKLEYTKVYFINDHNSETGMEGSIRRTERMHTYIRTTDDVFLLYGILALLTNMVYDFFGKATFESLVNGTLEKNNFLEFKYNFPSLYNILETGNISDLFKFKPTDIIAVDDTNSYIYSKSLMSLIDDLYSHDSTTLVDLFANNIALFSFRILHLTEHLKKNRQDKFTERSLVLLVGKRRKLLDYLKKRDIERYRSLIKELNLRK